MRITRLRTIALVPLFALLVGGVCWRSASAEQKAADAKPAITLPKDPKAIVLSYDPGAGGFIRKGPAPYLKIQADGDVTIVSPYDGSKKEAKLSAEQLQELLRFAVSGKAVFVGPQLQSIGRRAIAIGPVMHAGAADVVAVGKLHRAIC